MKISIRYQILSLMGAMLIAAMSTYLYLATSLFTSDKLAYLYDYNAHLAGTLAEEVNAHLNGKVDKLLYFGAEQAFSRGAASPAGDRPARSLFADDNDVLGLEVWERGDAGFERVYAFEDAERLASLDVAPGELTEVRSQHPLDAAVVAAEKVALQNASLPPDLAVLRLAALSADGRRIVVADLRPDRLLRIFSRPKLSEVYLVDGRGGVLVHPEPAKVVSHADASAVPVVQAALVGKTTRGVQEFDTPAGAMIGAFSAVDLGRLSVIVEVPKSEAMKASEELTRRSVLFAIFVMALALLASIYFSRRLAAPLRELEEKMAVISGGDLGVEVDLRSYNEIGALASAFNRMSRELRNREALLLEAHQQLIQSEKLSALGELSAGIAHEVKNPMVGICGFSELGASAKDMEEAREYFRLINSDALRANDILQTLLGFARPERLELEPLDANEVVRGAVRLVAHQLQILGAKLHTAYADGLPPIQGNANQLRQVLVNLMMNAGQALEGCEEKSVRISTRASAQGGVLIEVADTGGGMTEEVRHKLFHPFFTTKPHGKGTGLGLSVSKSIIVHHRGEITVRSEPGKGTAFAIRLPGPDASVATAAAS